MPRAIGIRVMIRHPDGSVECIDNPTGCCDVSGEVGTATCITECPICPNGTSSNWSFTIASIGDCTTVTAGTKTLEYDPSEDNECRWTYQNGEERWELFYDFQAPEGFQRWYLAGGDGELIYVIESLDCFDGGVNVFEFVASNCDEVNPDHFVIVDPVEGVCEGTADCISECPICDTGASHLWAFELASVGDCAETLSATLKTLIYAPIEDNPCRWEYSHAGEEWELYYDIIETMWLLVGGGGAIIYGGNDLDCLHSGVNTFALLHSDCGEGEDGPDAEVDVNPLGNGCSSFECDAGSCVEIDELGGYETMEECEAECGDGCDCDCPNCENYTLQDYPMVDNFTYIVEDGFWKGEIGTTISGIDFQKALLGHDPTPSDPDDNPTPVGAPDEPGCVPWIMLLFEFDGIMDVQKARYRVESWDGQGCATFTLMEEFYAPFTSPSSFDVCCDDEIDP